MANWAVPLHPLSMVSAVGLPFPGEVLTPNQPLTPDRHLRRELSLEELDHQSTWTASRLYLISSTSLCLTGDCSAWRAFICGECPPGSLPYCGVFLCVTRTSKPCFLFRGSGVYGGAYQKQSKSVRVTFMLSCLRDLVRSRVVSYWECCTGFEGLRQCLYLSRRRMPGSYNLNNNKKMICEKTSLSNEVNVK